MDEDVYSVGELGKREELRGIVEAVDRNYSSKFSEKLAKPINDIVKKITDYAIEKFNDWFYFHEVLGQHGKKFYVMKFRTMYDGANAVLKERLDKNGFDELGKPNDTEYVIPRRAWMRKYFFDEIPQIFWNILIQGDMRWVGERPQPADMWANYLKNGIITKEEMDESLWYLPGLFGVQYRYPESDSQEARRRYRAFKKLRHGSADLDYFIRICYNIIFRGLRSK